MIYLPTIIWQLELSTGQAAHLLGVSPLTIIKWCHAHDLPYTMLGTHRRIVMCELRDWLARALPQRHEINCKLSDDTRERIAAFTEGVGDGN